jgi:hypothetical protein
MPDIVRDPDTGEFMSVDDQQRAGHPDRPPIPSWGSAYVQHLGFGVSQEMDDDEMLAAETTEAVLSGRLDANEVAELVGLDVETICYYLTDAGSSADPSGVIAAVSTGINMSLAEDPYYEADWESDESGVAVFGESDTARYEAIANQSGKGDSGIDGLTDAGSTVVDRPGFLAGRVLAPSSSYEDASSSTGGAGDPVASEYQSIDYRDRYRTGPIVDQSDELTIRLGIGGGESVTGTYRVATRMSLYWQVAQVPGGRPDFGLPNL